MLQVLGIHLSLRKTHKTKKQTKQTPISWSISVGFSVKEIGAAHKKLVTIEQKLSYFLVGLKLKLIS